ncbi:hypothetical protein ACMFMF_008729 [Clarireedia jacksonii]
MHLPAISTPLLFTLLTLTPLSTLALDFIGTYNLATAARFDATLSDAANNITCSVSYEDTSSLLVADAEGYLASPVAMAMACSRRDYVATVVVQGKKASGEWGRKGAGEVKKWESTGALVLEDREVVITGYGLKKERKKERKRDVNLYIDWNGKIGWAAIILEANRQQDKNSTAQR